MRTSGFWYCDSTYLTLKLDVTFINFGTKTANNVALTVTVTNSNQGQQQQFVQQIGIVEGHAFFSQIYNYQLQIPCTGVNVNLQPTWT